MDRWSSRHAWVERARAYDAQLAEAAAEQRRAQYLAELAEHRRKSVEAGHALYAVAGRLFHQLNEQLARQPQTIIGQDGQRYEVPAMDVSPAMLATIAWAFICSLDLEPGRSA